ncbi:hypothetical protein B0H19DRAFT_1065440 [Mycena capillaripes]|nr:hypothetical protein B0H19DRAFT_1065440 [Mycena capillaripes]
MSGVLSNSLSTAGVLCREYGPEVGQEGDLNRFPQDTHSDALLTILRIDITILFDTDSHAQRSNHALPPRPASFIIASGILSSIALVDLIGHHPSARALLVVQLVLDPMSIPCDSEDRILSVLDLCFAAKIPRFCLRPDLGSKGIIGGPEIPLITLKQAVNSVGGLWACNTVTHHPSLSTTTIVFAHPSCTTIPIAQQPNHNACRNIYSALSYVADLPLQNTVLIHISFINLIPISCDVREIARQHLNCWSRWVKVSTSCDGNGIRGRLQREEHRKLWPILSHPPSFVRDIIHMPRESLGVAKSIVALLGVCIACKGSRELPRFTGAGEP